MTGMKRFYTVAGWIAIVYLLLLFFYPVLKVITTSIWIGENLSFDNYLKIFTTDLYTGVIAKTMWISVVSTLVALLIGYSLAYFIVTRPAEKQGLWLMLIISPMFMSLTVRLFGWMIVLSKQGPIADLASLLGNLEKAPSLLFSSVAVIIGIVHYVLPFVVLNIYASLKRMEPALLEASTMLGASGLRTFWHVIFPLSLPGVFSASSLAFALSASTFLVPIMLGGPKENLMANISYNSIITIGNMGLGTALSFVLLIIVVCVLLVMGRLERRGHHAA